MSVFQFNTKCTDLKGLRKGCSIEKKVKKYIPANKQTNNLREKIGTAVFYTLFLISTNTTKIEAQELRGIVSGYVFELNNPEEHAWAYAFQNGLNLPRSVSSIIAEAVTSDNILDGVKIGVLEYSIEYMLKQIGKGATWTAIGAYLGYNFYNYVDCTNSFNKKKKECLSFNTNEIGNEKYSIKEIVNSNNSADFLAYLYAKVSLIDQKIIDYKKDINYNSNILDIFYVTWEKSYKSSNHPVNKFYKKVIDGEKAIFIDNGDGHSRWYSETGIIQSISYSGEQILKLQQIKKAINILFLKIKEEEEKKIRIFNKNKKVYKRNSGNYNF